MVWMMGLRKYGYVAEEKAGDRRRCTSATRR